MTQKEAERRERFWVYGDFSEQDMEEMRRMYFEQRAEPVDIAGEFDTDMGTVFRIITTTPVSRRNRGTNTHTQPRG